MSDIHTSKAQLLQFEVEIDKQAKSCRPCMSAPETQVAKGRSQYDLCYKCQCQAKFDTEDNSRSEMSVEQNGQMVKTSKVLGTPDDRNAPFECANCDQSEITENWCLNNNFLRNDLEVSVTDCSNNMLVTGENNTVEDVNMRTECNIDGGDSSQPPKIQEDEFNPTKKKKKKKGLFGGGMSSSMLIILAIIFFGMFMLNKK
tara:strand:- start:149 stop:751 length:603 start_codon:yes stop_codon:yes gene_type:complete